MQVGQAHVIRVGNDNVVGIRFTSNELARPRVSGGVRLGGDEKQRFVYRKGANNSVHTGIRGPVQVDGSQDPAVPATR